MKLSHTPPVGDPRRVLFVQLRRIGDTLLGTPAVRALKQRFPNALIDFVVEDPAYEVLLGHPLINQVHLSPRGGLLSTVKLIRRLRRGKYDWVIDFLSNPRSAQYTRLSGAPVRIGLDRPGRRYAYTHRAEEEPGDQDLYAASWRLEILRLLGVPGAGLELEIYSDQADTREGARGAEAAAGLPGPLIAVAVGSSNPAKRYPTRLTAAVIELLQQKGASCILTAGPGEGGLAEAVLSHAPGTPAVLRNARVPTLCGLYRRCDAFVGPDSGPKHIAAACGLSTVTVFGPGRPSAWNDLKNPRQVVIAAPCDIRPRCVEQDCGRARHIGLIEPAQVAEAALALVSRGVPESR